MRGLGLCEGGRGRPASEQQVRRLRGIILDEVSSASLCNYRLQHDLLLQDAGDLFQDLPESGSNPFINLELNDSAELADKLDLVDHDVERDETAIETNLVDSHVM